MHKTEYVVKRSMPCAAGFVRITTALMGASKQTVHVECSAQPQCGLCLTGQAPIHNGRTNHQLPMGTFTGMPVYVPIIDRQTLAVLLGTIN